MDDADGGRRGLRAHPGARLLATIEARYGLGSSLGVRDLGGSSNLNLLLGGGPRYVVRVHRRYVTAARLGAIQEVRRILTAGGVPCAPVVRTLQGEPWIVFEGRLVEVEAFVDHDAEMDSWERLEVGMPLLGRIHSVLRRVDAGEGGRQARFANHIDAAEVVPSTGQGVERIRGWGPTPDESRIADAAEELAAVVAAAEAPLVSSLPRQLVHGDFWDNNVLFKGGRPVLVADFDFMGERTRIDDLALTLYFASCGFLRDADPGECRGRVWRLLDRYETGLDLGLSSTERAALPLALARQPLWSIGGWVARLDSDSAARRHVDGLEAPLRAALAIIADLPRWRDTFA